MSVSQPNNIWGRSLADEFDEVYLKKSGDTATGLITFDAGIAVEANSVFDAEVDVNGTLTCDNIFVNDSIQVLGEVETDDLQVNGNTELIGIVNFGQWTLPQNTPKVYTNRSAWEFGSPSTGGGGGGRVDFETTVSFGGFSSCDFGIIPIITAPMPPSNDSTTKIPTTAWVQGAISSSQPINITPNSITITPNPTTGVYSGIRNYTNTGCIRSISKQAVNQVATATVTWQNITSGVYPASANMFFVFEILFTVCSNNNPATAFAFFKTKVMVWPYRFLSGAASPWGGTTFELSTNSLNGDTTFAGQTSGSPAGRQYWSYDMASQGITLVPWVTGTDRSITFNIPNPFISPAQNENYQISIEGKTELVANSSQLANAYTISCA